MRADGVRCDDGIVGKSSRVDVVGDLGLRQNAKIDVHLRHGAQASDEPFATPASNVPCTEAKALVLLWIRIEMWCRGGHSTHRRKSTEGAVENFFHSSSAGLTLPAYVSRKRTNSDAKSPFPTSFNEGERQLGQENQASSTATPRDWAIGRGCSGRHAEGRGWWGDVDPLCVARFLVIVITVAKKREKCNCFIIWFIP